MTGLARPRVFIPLIAGVVVALIVATVLITLSVASGPAAPEASSDPQADYLLALQAAQPTVLDKVHGQELRLVYLGQQSCEIVRTGGSFGEAETSMQTYGGLTADEASAVTYMAKAYFCPRIG